jgi:hypothetical protein
MGDKTTSNNEQTFSDVIRGMQYAVNTAQEYLQQYQFELLTKYFEFEDGGAGKGKIGKPRMLDILLPSNRRVAVPKISIIPQSMLAIEELDMSFSVAIAHTEVKPFEEAAKRQAAGVNDESQSRSRLYVSFARRNPPAKGGFFNRDKNKEESIPQDGFDTIQVNIKFKSIELTEGAARIQDMLNLEIESREPPVVGGGKE